MGDCNIHFYCYLTNDPQDVDHPNIWLLLNYEVSHLVPVVVTEFVHELWAGQNAEEA